MTKAEKKIKAQDLIMDVLSTCGYKLNESDEYKDFAKEEDAELILKRQMDRVGKLFGFPEAWFS